jgi:hypothetical protein
MHDCIDAFQRGRVDAARFGIPPDLVAFSDAPAPKPQDTMPIGP